MYVRDDIVTLQNIWVISLIKEDNVPITNFFILPKALGITNIFCKRGKQIPFF